MTNFVYIAASIDGYIATSDGGVEWLDNIPNPDQTDYGYADFMNGIDALVMGRYTFEKVLSFNAWPYQKPVFVTSSQLRDVPRHLSGQVEILQGTAVELVAVLNNRGFQRLYIDGGKLITSFLREDLIDEMIITRIPLLLGNGIPLFGNIPNPLSFTLMETRRYSNSLTINHYKRMRQGN